MDKAIICFQTGIAVIFVKTISENEPLYKLRIILILFLKLLTNDKFGYIIRMVLKIGG